MIQKAINILKVRKSETARIVCLLAMLYSLSSVSPQLMKLFMVTNPLILFFVFLFFCFVSMILSLGFQRTLVFSPNHKLSLLELCKIGYSYLWKVCAFYVAVGVVFVLMIMIFTMVFKKFLPEGTINGFLFRILVSSLSLVFVKWFYFVPAQIIVYNRNTNEALLNIRQFGGREINKFIRLCVLLHLIILIVSNAITLLPHDSALYLVSLACQVSISCVITFLLSLTAVLYVHERFLLEQENKL